MEHLKQFIAKDQHLHRVRELKGKADVYLVGGTIRDILLGIVPQDYDFATSGSGIRFARKFGRTIDGSFVLLDREHDEARVVKDEVIYDFVGTGDDGIIADLGRRDFTINAMAINISTLEFLDPHQGMRDLEKGMIRPLTEESLKTDPLRILRGFRLSLELKFELSKEFYAWAHDVHLTKVAAERVGYEIARIMSAPHSYTKIRKMNELGLFAELFPEANKIIDDPYLWGHSLNTYYALEELMSRGFFTMVEPEFNQYFSVPRRILLVKLAGLFHDVAKPDTFLLKDGDVHFYGHDTKGAKIVHVLGYKRLKYSRSDVTVLTKLVKQHMRLHLLATSPELTDRAIRRFFRDLGDEWFGAMMIAWADGYATAGWTKHLEAVFMRMIEVKRADDARPKVEPLVNGYDLIGLGLTPGPKFKIILQELLDMQLEGTITTKEEGLKRALEIHERLP